MKVWKVFELLKVLTFGFLLCNDFVQENKLSVRIKTEFKSAKFKLAV